MTDEHSQENNTSSDCRPPLLKQKHAVVIGAGMAGIKLAHTLLHRRETWQVTVLEANDYIGGRICSTQFEGYTVELGANWISGLEGIYDNPIWKLAQQVQLQGHESNRDDQTSLLALHGENGSDVTEEYIETLQQFEDIYENAVTTCARQGIQPENDVDVMTLLEQSGWKSESEQTMIQQAVQTNVLDVWVANDLSHLSAAHDLRPGMNDVDLGKEEVFVEDPRGFNTILNDMVNDIQKLGGTIQLNTVVKRVEYAPENVQVQAKHVDSGEQVVNYCADIVVCTTSLGVLQNEQIEFIPPLPDWKKQAIHEIGMFSFAKVFARFDDAFQPNEDQFAICTKNKGYYPFWMKYKNASDNLYMCHLGGLEAERVESLSPHEITNEIEELFRNAFSIQLVDADPTIFRPTVVAVTNWSKNPQFCGSYSYFPVHAFATVREADLTCALTGIANNREGQKTLYFAGEAFDDKFNGWVQGAYRSGERVAKSIIDDTC